MSAACAVLAQAPLALARGAPRGRAAAPQAMRPVRRPSAAPAAPRGPSRWTAGGGAAQRGGPLRYKEHEVEAEVHDWRIKLMCEIAHRYYAEVWSKGSVEAMDEILDDDVELKDELWGTHPFVGRYALKKQVLYFRQLYPDLVMEIDQVGVYGTQDISISWSARATNLGGPHPTHHYTHFRGVSALHFSKDRKRIASVVTYRQPTAEEMNNKCEISRHSERSCTEIQLVPLHVSTANYDYLPGLNKDTKGKKDGK